MPGSTPSWASVLDDLERSIEDADRARSGGLAGPVDGAAAWQAPMGLGPLPEHLTARARDLSERQRRIIEELGSLLATTREELLASRRTGRAATRPTSRPTAAVYVDVTT